MIKFSTLFICISLFAWACKTPVKAYDKGDYNNAIELSIRKLQKNPNDGETKALLQNAYRFAVQQGEEKIRSLANSNNDTRFEQMYFEYQKLQALYTTLQQYPSLTSHVRTTDYSSYVSTYKQKAGEVYLQKALQYLDLKNKEGYRKAYYAFQSAYRYSNNDVSIKEQMDAAYNMALVRIVILPLQDNYGNRGNYSGYPYANNYQLKNFEEELMRNLRYQGGNDFVKYYSDWDARSKDIHPDELLELRLGRLELGRPYDQTRTRTVSKEVVVRETVYKPDSVVKQYQRVSAQITTTRRTMVSSGDLLVTSTDDRGRILWNDVFRGEHRWTTEFASYRGDERALSEQDRALMNRYDRNEPNEDEVMEIILRHIQSEISQRLRSRFNRYY